MPAPPLTSRTPRPGLSRPAPCLADERVLRPRRNDAHDPAAVLDRQSSLPTMLDTSDMRYAGELPLTPQAALLPTQLPA